MKASHRKDVIIARIIFAIICAALARRNYNHLSYGFMGGMQENQNTGNGNHK